jgi:hypothetical protein
MTIVVDLKLGPPKVSIFFGLFIYCFKSRSRIFHLHRDVTIAGEGLQNLGLCSSLRTFEQEGMFFRATPAVTRGLGFSGFIQSTPPPYSVGSNDTQGDVEDLF